MRPVADIRFQKENPNLSHAEMTTTLEGIDEALCLAEGEIVSFYGFAYPTRSVIVRSANSGNSTGRHSAIISWPS